jgi:4-nitrophenyl phosphatase
MSRNTTQATVNRQMEKDIRRVKNFLLDMDGTIYLGSRLFPGTLPLLEKLKKTGRRALFLTNNSSMSPADYAAKLCRMGIQAEPGDVFTSGDAAAAYLKKHLPGGKRVFLLGTPSLEKQMRDEGFDIINGNPETEPDLVLLGFDKTLTYEKIMLACRHISRGAPFYATHPDLVCPVEDGFIPDAGAMIKMFEAAAGVSPTVIGKPRKAMAEAVFERCGFLPEQTAMVGDRLATDIAFANQSGIYAVLVLSGETDLAAYRAQNEVWADFIYPSVSELCAAL